MSDFNGEMYLDPTEPALLIRMCDREEYLVIFLDSSNGEWSQKGIEGWELNLLPIKQGELVELIYEAYKEKR